jgi:hypothetical protein
VAKGNTEDHIGEHDVLLADMRLVETDSRKDTRNRYVEDAFLAEYVDCSLRNHLERVSPGFFKQFLGH